jgi:NAD(P)-dependent dehydrogenase (short-subunit alcohol dehydrogenase family)
VVDLHDRTIVVTGGASGIGRAGALLLAEHGARVGILDVDEEGVLLVREEAMRRGARSALGLRCDVGSESDVEQAFILVERELGPVRGAFVNAGIERGGLTHNMPAADWEQVINTNLTGTFYTCKWALRSMLAGGSGGSIVCTSSPLATVAVPSGGAAAYSASKAGIAAFVRCLAIDYASSGIRVNSIAPGATDTSLMWSNTPPDEIPQLRERINSEVPLGRLAEPREPASVAVWLLSDEASYITGSYLVCDGGILAKASITS